MQFYHTYIIHVCIDTETYIIFTFYKGQPEMELAEFFERIWTQVTEFITTYKDSLFKYTEPRLNF